MQHLYFIYYFMFTLLWGHKCSICTIYIISCSHFYGGINAASILYIYIAERRKRLGSKLIKYMFALIMIISTFITNFKSF